MKTVLKVLIDTNGANCGSGCRFLDVVVDCCTLFGGLDYAGKHAYARHANCVKAGVAMRPGYSTVRGQRQVVRTTFYSHR